MADQKAVLLRFGFTDKAADSTLTNAELTGTLFKMFEAVRPGSTQKEYKNGRGNEERLGPLLNMVATTWPAQGSASARGLVEMMIGEGELDTAARVKEALAAVKEAGHDGSLSWESLKVRCGVGVVQNEPEVRAALKTFLEQHKAAVLAGRYPAANTLRTDFSKLVKWADGKVVQQVWDEELLALLGPKDSKENVAAMKKKEEPKKKEDPKKKAGPAAAEEPESLGIVAGMDRLGTPQENKQTDPALLEAHLKATGGVVVTRFPPEPNGYLHLGHCLSMARVFGYAEAKGGYCILRYDDTNPEAEKQEYIDSILNDVQWMGYKPKMITYASDNFQKLYDFAEQLIKKNLAYVCDLPMEAMREGRRLKLNSPFRNRSIEENLTLFRKMRDGYFEEGACTLRVKGDMQHENPNMRDFVAYRIKYMPHPHAGDKWCIYPSYDYTHAICDSLENITHSICTLEFVSRNLTYQWLLDAIGIYKPPQLEAQRLSMTHIMLSKRKLLKLVEAGYVSGWTDPRMPTIMGVRRKGYPPRALHEFMLGMGLSRSADGMIPIERLEESIRSYLNTRAARAMAVKDPLLVVVDNWDGPDEVLSVPDFPEQPERGSHERIFGKEVYITRKDYRDVDNDQYFGLAPGKRVRLKYAYIVQHVRTEKDAEGRPIRIHVTYDKDRTAKVKGTLSWVGKSESAPAELRLLRQLFKSPTPGITITPEGPVKKNFLDDLHPNSLNPFPHALVERRVASPPIGTTFQFERMGYFTVDPDSKNGRTVFNRTVSSKQTKVKF